MGEGALVHSTAKERDFSAYLQDDFLLDSSVVAWVGTTTLFSYSRNL